MDSAAFSLIGELESAIARGESDTRVNTLRRITDLFIGHAASATSDQVELFDEVIGRLAVDIETKARAELAKRLGPIPAAPVNVVTMLAKDEDIEVARPILTESERIDESTILEIAKARGQDHLLAISQRRSVPAAITDVLVDRGDKAVLRTVADNKGANFSEHGFNRLVTKSEGDDVLAVSVASRVDLPPEHFSRIVARASEEVLNRLRSETPQLSDHIETVISTVTEDMHRRERKERDYSVAMSMIQLMQRSGELTEDAVGNFAKRGQFEELVCAVAALCRLPPVTVGDIIEGERRDSVLIIARAARLSWSTAKLLLSAAPGSTPPSPHDLSQAENNYRNLNTSTAQRVLRFFQVRLSAGKDQTAPQLA